MASSVKFAIINDFNIDNNADYICSIKKFCFTQNK